MTQGYSMFPETRGALKNGQEPLLPPDKLTVLLYRRAKGVRAKVVAGEFGLTDWQVHHLVGKNRAKIDKFRKLLAYFEVKRTVRGLG